MKIVNCFLSISRSLDFYRQGLLQHHQRTALISAKIGRAIGLDITAFLELFQASIIHDIGILNWQEKGLLLFFEIECPWTHCKLGYEFLKSNASLSHLAEVIYSHHDKWEGGNPSGLSKSRIPLCSRIIHLADRIDILASDGEQMTKGRRKEIVDIVTVNEGKLFDPELVSIFHELAQKDCFWFDLSSPWEQEYLIDLLPFSQIPMDYDYLLDIARLFATVVDTKSPFTFRHSNGVAAVAKFLGQQSGMSDECCVQMEISGLLHDLGKLAIPAEILEKQTGLSSDEFNIMKQHPYYTYWLLKPVTQTFPLEQWAGYHHEKLNGEGYPFGKKAGELDLQSNLITLADIYVALREDRPYRPCLKQEQIVKLINEMLNQNQLNSSCVDLLFDNQVRLDQLWDELSIRMAAESKT